MFTAIPTGTNAAPMVTPRKRFRQRSWIAGLAARILPVVAPDCNWHGARTCGFGGGRVARFANHSRLGLGAGLSPNLWAWRHRGNDADHGRNRRSCFLFDAVSISASASRDRGGRSQSGLRAVSRLPDRVCRRSFREVKPGSTTPATAVSRERVRIVVRGAVQGVGFRPFVYRLATELGLAGWIVNSAQGVVIEIEGASDRVSGFAGRLRTEKPARAIIQSCESSHLDARGYDKFEIRESTDHGGKSALILPDIATCDDCLREIFDPGDRRFRYPFANCTNCGPRFSIIEALPYDRANTSMKKFEMCVDCAREYCDPANRRFHAEPTACPRCGPQLQLWNPLGESMCPS